jgi:hypothetical protein
MIYSDAGGIYNLTENELKDQENLNLLRCTFKREHLEKLKG